MNLTNLTSLLNQTDKPAETGAKSVKMFQDDTDAQSGEAGLVQFGDAFSDASENASLVDGGVFIGGDAALPTATAPIELLPLGGLEAAPAAGEGADISIEDALFLDEGVKVQSLFANGPKLASAGEISPVGEEVAINITGAPSDETLPEGDITLDEGLTRADERAAQVSAKLADGQTKTSVQFTGIEQKAKAFANGKTDSSGESDQLELGQAALEGDGEGDGKSVRSEIAEEGIRRLSFSAAAHEALQRANMNAQFGAHGVKDQSPAESHPIATALEGGGEGEIKQLGERGSVQGLERGASIGAPNVINQIVAAISGRGGETKLELRLNPPELGRVTIGFEGEGVELIRAVVSAESPETIDLMRKNLDMLARELAKHGLDNVNVELGHRDDNSPTQDREDGSLALNGDETPAVEAENATDERIIQIDDGRIDRRV